MTEEDLERRVVDLESRLKFVEERTSAPRTINHEGVAVIPGSCLEGGGTIDQSRAIAFTFRNLSTGVPSAKAEVLFFEPKENEFYVCSFADFVDATVKASWLPSRLDGLERILRELQRKLAVFSIYERLQVLENTVEVVECEIEELKEGAEKSDAT